MGQYFEAWQLDMIASGDAPPEWVEAANDYINQEHLEMIRREEQQLFEKLYRVTCPEPLALGEWHLGLLEESAFDKVSAHLNQCPHCQEELAQLIENLERPLRLREAPASLVKRIVLTLQTMMGNGGAPIARAALRGNSWTVCYASGNYMVSLTQQTHPSGIALMGSLLSPTTTGRAALRQGAAVRYDAPLSQSATFTFDGVTPGKYDLIIEVPDAELVVPDLNFTR